MDNPAHRFITENRHRDMEKMLKENGIISLKSLKLLEIGCGSGSVLEEFQQMGIDDIALFGIDLLYDRLVEAKANLLTPGIYNADGQNLPFSQESFDLVLQYTAFSSVLDPNIKRNMATEITRVLKPGGFVIWYDFWWNPLNAQTKGITPKEIKHLFPHSKYSFKKITLAPPIARKVVPVSRLIASILEKTNVLNTHFLVFIQKAMN
ncbi:MAG: class I SAM-dependent methyltransferase [Anaerolineaceae bacterium]|jgi:ubiquinone/menaquinone biosynthesis C-methylase UbiE